MAPIKKNFCCETNLYCRPVVLLPFSSNHWRWLC